MLDLPRIVEAKAVGEDDLVERFVEQPLLVARLPRTRQLKLVEKRRNLMVALLTCYVAFERPLADGTFVQANG